jgi:hypothetical protein
MKTLLAVLLGAFAASTLAAPKAESAVECGIAAGKELMKDILDAAYRTNGATSQKFAEDLFAACLKTGGNMDTILGRRL